MPITKDAYSRYKIIDQVLRRSGYTKTARLAEICTERLGKPVSERTIQKDINDLREDTALKIYAPILYCNRRKAHYYPDDVNEIFPAIELDDNEINALLFYGRMQNQYQNYGIFKDITAAIEKVFDAANIQEDYKNLVSNQPLIHTETIPPLKGSELLIKIIQALKSRKKLRFEYGRFIANGIEKSDRIISPYLLKEDKHMWYIIGCMEGRKDPTTFAVDRMSNLRIVNQPAAKINFDPEAYFKYSFGVTAPDELPVDVVLSFTAFQGNYIKSLPIHSSQRILKDNKKELRISVKVIPTYEFYSKILSYGQSLKVISPAKVRNAIKSQLADTLANYK